MTAEPVDERIVAVLREELLAGSDRPIAVDEPLGELGIGLDSLGLIKAVIAIENAFGVQLPDDILASPSSITVSRLAELVGRAPGVRPREVDVSLRDSTIPPRHHRMERLAYTTGSRGVAGRALWAAARVVWPVKRFAFSRSRHLLLERRLDAEQAPVSPPPGIELRAYAPEDGERLESLWPGFMRRPSLRLVARALGDGAIALVATDGGRVVALDLLSGDGASGEIVLEPARAACWGLYLVEAPDCRGRGIGLALLAHSLRVARELGYRAQLAAVRDDNMPMLAASVQLLGFQPIGYARRTRVLGLRWWTWEIDGEPGRGRLLRV